MRAKNTRNSYFSPKGMLEMNDLLIQIACGGEAEQEVKEQLIKLGVSHFFTVEEGLDLLPLRDRHIWKRGSFGTKGQTYYAIV